MKQKHNKFRHFAVADLGSAALRLDLYSWDGPPNKTLKLEKKARCLPRLGKLQQSQISIESLKEVEAELINFRSIIHCMSNLSVAAVCTAFMRKASNAEEIQKKLSHSFGSPFRILSGYEEATLIAKGIFTFESNLPREILLLDIGGGSSEISIIKASAWNTEVSDENPKPELFLPYSLDLGALCISELLPKFYGHITHEQIESTKTFIRERLNSLIPQPLQIDTLIGSSGTIRAVGNLYKRRENSSNASLQSQHISVPSEFTNELLALLLSLPEDELNEFIMTERHRKDLLIGGLLILQEVISHFSIKIIRITDFSLRHGVLRELLEEVEGSNLKVTRPFFHASPGGWKVE